MTQLLELVEIIRVPAVTKFIANEKFVEGKIVDDIFIECLGKNFTKILLKTEERDIPEADLRVWRLTEDVNDELILRELGGKETAKIFLSNFWEMLRQKVKNGEVGQFLSYFFFNNGVEEHLRIIFAIRASADDGWYISTASVQASYPWSTNVRIISY